MAESESEAELDLFVIAHLFTLDDSVRRLYTINILFQVLNVTKENDGYLLTLSDSRNHYDYFLLTKKEAEMVKIKPEPYDIIKVGRVIVQKGNPKRFYIKNISFVKKMKEKIGDPVDYMQEITQKFNTNSVLKSNGNITNIKQGNNINTNPPFSQISKLDLSRDIVNENKNETPSKYKFYIFDSHDREKRKSTSEKKENYKLLATKDKKGKYSVDQSENAFIIPDDKPRTTFRLSPSKYKDIIDIRRPSKVNYYWPISLLSGLVTEFTIKGRVLEVANYEHTIEFCILDSNKSKAKVIIYKKFFWKYKGLIKINKVYSISNGTVHNQHIQGIKYLIRVQDATKIEEIEDDDTILKTDENLSNLSMIEDLYLNNSFTIDTIVYVIDVFDNSKKYDLFRVKKLTVTDMTNYTILLYLSKIICDHECKNIKTGDTLDIKKAIINYEIGFNLTTTYLTQVDVNPSNKQAWTMRTYCDNYIGGRVSLSDFANCAPVKHVKIRDLLQEMDVLKPPLLKYEITRLKARIIKFTHSKDYVYLGCPYCSKKLSLTGAIYECKTCKKVILQPVYYYKITLMIVDCSNEYEMMIFKEVGERLFKIPAEKYFNISIFNTLPSNKELLDSIIKDLEYKEFYFIVRPEFKFYNDEYKKTLYLVNFEIVNRRKEILSIYNI